MTTLTKDIVRRMPKVALHEHLDGGLRPQSILELAAISLSAWMNVPPTLGSSTAM